MSFKIRALGRDGVGREYEGEIVRQGPEWIFRIPCSLKQDFFEAVFVEVGGGWIQSTVLWNHCGDEHSAKGIPDALFAYIVDASGLRLRSSRRDDALGFRTKDADTVWERQVSKALARYDDAEDRFIYLRAPPPRAPGIL